LFGSLRALFAFNELTHKRLDLFFHLASLAGGFFFAGIVRLVGR
jgi:hypothetical protein